MTFVRSRGKRNVVFLFIVTHAKQQTSVVQPKQALTCSMPVPELERVKSCINTKY